MSKRETGREPPPSERRDMGRTPSFAGPSRRFEMGGERAYTTPPNAKALLEASGLCKHFDLGRGRVLHAVDDVSLRIAESEIVGLVGESGSGKSTFGRMLVGLHGKTAGEVRFDGEKLPRQYKPADFRRHARRMQMIFQDPYSSLNPRMTIGEIIGEGLRLNTAYTAARIRQEVGGWLERVGLERAHAARYPHEFSGGQRQRVGIARALIVQPRFVVCDEPISALDVSVQAQIVRLLGGLKASLGLTMLFVAHDLSMVRYVSDRMAVMYMGSLVEIGPSEEVYFKPLHPYTQLLVGSNPQPDPRAERRRPTLPMAGEIISPVNLGPGCRFASRCPKVMSVCRSKTPQLHAVPAPGGSAAAGGSAAPGGFAAIGGSGSEAGAGSTAAGERQRRVACHLVAPAPAAGA